MKLEHISLKIFGYKSRVFFLLSSMWRRLKQHMKFLWLTESDMLIVVDTEGLSSEDIRQIKELLCITKKERQK